MKKCPYCAEEIQDEAIKCRYCGEMLNGPKPKSKKGVRKYYVLVCENCGSRERVSFSYRWNPRCDKCDNFLPPRNKAVEIIEEEYDIEKEFKQKIADYTNQGYEIVSMSEYEAQLKKPKEFSVGLFIFLFLLFAIPGIIYLIYWSVAKPELIYIKAE